MEPWAPLPASLPAALRVLLCRLHPWPPGPPPPPFLPLASCLALQLTASACTWKCRSPEPSSSSSPHPSVLSLLTVPSLHLSAAVRVGPTPVVGERGYCSPFGVKAAWPSCPLSRCLRRECSPWVRHVRGTLTAATQLGFRNNKREWSW